MKSKTIDYLNNWNERLKMKNNNKNEKDSIVIEKINIEQEIAKKENMKIEIESIKEKNQKLKMEMNNVLVDLLIKSSKVSTIINMLLDINNMFQLNDFVIVSSDKYKILQDSILKTIESLNTIYLNVNNELTKGVKNGK